MKSTIASEAKKFTEEEVKELVKKLPAKTSFWKIFSKNYEKDLAKILSQLDRNTKEDLLKLLADRKKLKIFIDDFGKNHDLIKVINKFPKSGIDAYGKLAKGTFGSNHALVEWLCEFRHSTRLDPLLYESLSTELLKDGSLKLVCKKSPASEIIFDGVKFIARAGGKRPTGGGPINEFLMSKRMPNIEYIVDGVSFKTDRFGRTAFVKGEVSPSHIKNKPARNTSSQTSSVERMGGNKATDQGGHFWGNQFGGPNEDINLSPMLTELNNGQYKSIESAITKAINEGKTVKLNIQALYKDGSESMRPAGYIYEYVIDGKLKRVVMYN